MNTDDALTVARRLLADEQLPSSDADRAVLGATLSSMRRLGAVFDEVLRGEDEVGPGLRAPLPMSGAGP